MSIFFNNLSDIQKLWTWNITKFWASDAIASSVSFLITIFSILSFLA